MKSKICIAILLIIIVFCFYLFFSSENSEPDKIHINETNSKQVYDLNYRFYKGQSWDEKTFVSTNTTSEDDKQNEILTNKENFHVNFKIDTLSKGKPENIISTLKYCNFRLKVLTMDGFMKDEFVIVKIKKNRNLEIVKYSEDLQRYIDTDGQKMSRILIFTKMLTEERMLLPYFAPDKKCPIGYIWEKEADLILRSYPMNKTYKNKNIKLNFLGVKRSNNLIIAEISYKLKFNDVWSDEPSQSFFIDCDLTGNIYFNVSNGQIVKNNLEINEYTRNIKNDNQEWGLNTKTSVTILYKYNNLPEVGVYYEKKEDKHLKLKGKDE